MQSEMLTAKEAAQFARVSLDQLYRVLHGRINGVPKLPYVEIGRRYLIRKETLKKWLTEVEVASMVGHEIEKGDCIRSNVFGICDTCKAYGVRLHIPMLVHGFYCEDCCPQCGGKGGQPKGE